MLVTHIPTSQAAADGARTAVKFAIGYLTLSECDAEKDKYASISYAHEFAFVREFVKLAGVEPTTEV